MKYDFSKCNNLRWKSKSTKQHGRVKIDGMWIILIDKIEEVPYTTAETLYSAIPDFEIVPRDPKTYEDWQVGDIIMDESGGHAVIDARINNIVFVVDPIVHTVDTYTCKELVLHGFRLVLTDYEKELIGKADCEFKEGDIVLVRDSDEPKWVSGIFERADFLSSYPYKIQGGSYEQCIPYNEKTWRLLGTTDDYNEEGDE